MPERDHPHSPEHPDPDPFPDDRHEQLLATKDRLKTLWRELPVAHQATMAMVLMQPVMDGKWGTWLKEAIALRWPEEDNPLHKPFPVTSICRADLQEIQFTGAEIAGLSDEDMTHIASRMEDLYVESAFWETLEGVANDVLAGKEAS